MSVQRKQMNVRRSVKTPLDHIHVLAVMVLYSTVTEDLVVVRHFWSILSSLWLNWFTDIDECSDGLATCDQLCNNTVGSYYCGCLAGYRLLSDDITCQSKFTHQYKHSYNGGNVYFRIDINECIEDIDDCAQICIDTLGSYTCSCGPGYRLASDDHQCDGIYVLPYTY